MNWDVLSAHQPFLWVSAYRNTNKSMEGWENWDNQARKIAVACLRIFPPVRILCHYAPFLFHYYAYLQVQLILSVHGVNKFLTNRLSQICRSWHPRARVSLENAAFADRHLHFLSGWVDFRPRLANNEWHRSWREWQQSRTLAYQTSRQPNRRIQWVRNKSHRS